MVSAYRVRLLVWGAMVVGVGWLLTDWFPRELPYMAAPSALGVAPAASPGGLTDALNRRLGWVSDNSLALGTLALLMLLGWGWLARGLGAYDLIYSESRSVRFVNGLLIGLAIGEILFVEYLVAQAGLPAADGAAWTLWPAEVAGPRPDEALAVRRAGGFLLATWPAALLLFYLPGGLAKAPDGRRLGFPALGLGLVAAVALVVVATRALWLGEVAADWRDWYGTTPGAMSGRIPRPDFPLHLLATAATALPALGLAAFGALAYAGRTACPVWVVALLLWLAVAVYGFILFHFQGLQYVLAALAVAVGVAANLGHRFKLSLPNLRPEYDAARRATLDFARLGEPPTAQKPVKLLSADDLLAAFAAQWQREHGPASKPKLVVMATSGGGIRAAVWTAAVLEKLEAEIGPRFPRHLRIITGASGGMVGAGLYAADRVHPVAGDSLARTLAQDSLWALMQTFLIRDLPSTLLPFHRDWDRGYSLEAAWHRRARARRRGDKSPWRTTFAELMPAERLGIAPSLVYAPFLVEDGRRLLISNLDLRDIAAESAPTLTLTPGGMPSHAVKRLSRSAVEFFRLFPAAHGRFEVGTAARLNATFPFVSPSVNLPTDPPRRVVDAGYFDNYGTGLLAAWLHRHRDAVREYCSGVAIVEVRAFPMEREKNAFADEEFEDHGLAARLTGTIRSLTSLTAKAARPPRPDSGGRGDTFVSLLAGLSTPAEALVSVRSAGAYFRNDQFLGVLDSEFNERGRPPFLVRVPFECPGEAALSWGLTDWDRDQILRGVHDNAVGVAALKGWLGCDGGAC